MKLQSRLVETKGRYKKYEININVDGLRYYAIQSVKYYIPKTKQNKINYSESITLNKNYNNLYKLYTHTLWTDVESDNFPLYADLFFTDGNVGKGDIIRLKTIS